MKVISLGMDQKMFEDGSAVRQRVASFGALFDELHIVVFTPNQEKFKKQNIAPNVFLYPTRSRVRALYVFDFLRIIRGIIRESGRKDVVVTVQDPFEIGLVGLLAKLCYRLPLQVQIHTDFANRYFITHSFTNFVRFIISFPIISVADTVRAVSARVIRSVSSLSNHLSVLPVKLNLKSNVLKQEGPVSLLTVARLEKEKDIATAIRALAQVVERGVSLKFTIVGDGRERRKLEMLVKQLSLESLVSFEGWQSDISQYYKKGVIYVSTSLYEGYGMSIVEAALSGASLIISDTGVAGEIFRNKEEAFVVPQRNINEFANSMYMLAINSTLRESMATNAEIRAKGAIIPDVEYSERFRDSLQHTLKVWSWHESLFKKNILLRYFVSGLTAASTNIGLLYVFTDIVGIWYLYSSMLAFVCAITISFSLQKFWAFADKNLQSVHYQLLKYVGVAILGILLNIACMFILVDLFGMWYIFAQIITGAFVAVLNFLMYKFFIFQN